VNSNFVRVRIYNRSGRDRIRKGQKGRESREEGGGGV
jgi:hypothetical protein